MTQINLGINYSSNGSRLPAGIDDDTVYILRDASSNALQGC